MTSPILITGGATRLGFALANHFLNQKQTVAITYRSERPEIKDLKDRGAQVFYADFSTDEGIYEASQTLKHGLPKLKSLVHNASTWSLDEESVNQLDILALMMRVHVGAPMAISEALVPALKRSDIPSIINISDHVAIRGSDRHMAYAASKSALINLSKSQAKKYAPEIRVNALCPALLEFRDEDNQDYRNKASSKNPLRLVPGFAVAISAICFLQENPYITGITLPLDGGRPLWMP